MATGDGFPTAIIVSFVFFYSVVFLLSIAGNVVVLYSCYKVLKRRQSTLKWFIANLALADLTFTVLTTFDSVNFLWTWLGGKASCKLQGFLIEACYTASIMTLVVISSERRKAVVTPFSTRMDASDGNNKKLVLIWIASLLIGSPLLYAYEVQMATNHSVICSNASFGDLQRQIYYSIHAVFVFIIPLTYMICAQTSVFKTLRSRVFPIRNAFTNVSSTRHRKVAKTLATLTVVFTVCWTPFITVRTMMYFHLIGGGYIFRTSQLLILLNAALNPFLYGIYGENNGRIVQRFKWAPFPTTVTRIENSSIRSVQRKSSHLPKSKINIG